MGVIKGDTRSLDSSSDEAEDLGISVHQLQVVQLRGSGLDFRRTPPTPVIVTIRENRDYIGVQLYSYDTTITGWGSS